MPYIVTISVATIGGAFHERGHVVSDARGKEILAEHPDGATRIVHDDDLCAVMHDTQCAHESHDWNAAPTAAAPLRLVPPPALEKTEA